MRKRRSQRKKDSSGSIVWNILGTTLRVILISVIAVSAVLITNDFKDPSYLPRVAGYRPTAVLLGSMEPAFYPGDVILTKDTGNPSTLQAGDAICYQYSRKVAIHKVVQVPETEGKVSCVTKDDNNDVEDRLAVELEQIEGVWDGTRIPAFGNALMLAQTSMGMLVLTIHPLAALFLWDLLKRRGNGSKGERRTEELGAEPEVLKAAQKEKTSGDI